MESQIESILINTYNPDQSLRIQAENALAQLLTQTGSFSQLLYFISQSNVYHRDLRLAACITIKNKIREYWSDDVSDDRKVALIDVTEKNFIKSSIFPMLLIESDTLLKNLIAEIIKGITEFDFPDNWSSLLPSILDAVQNAGSNVLQMSNALLALRKIVKRYEFKADEHRGPLNDIVEKAFPMLQKLIEFIIENNSIEAALVMKLCFKIFYSATMYALPKAQGIDIIFWFRVIGYVIEKVLPEASEGIEPLGQPILHEERKSWPWWKLKKWATKISALFIQRYGNPKYVNEENKSFALYFRDTISVILLQPTINVLSMRASGRYIAEDTHRQCLVYLTNSVEMAPTYKVIKKQIDHILFEIVFPSLCVDPADVELFRTDPNEFIRKCHDPMEDWADPKVAAINLLQTLAKYRQKDVLPKYLPFLAQILSTYNAADAANKNYSHKDGVLVSMSSLFKVMNESKAYRSQLEPFVSNHLLHEFQSPVDYIRYKACWAVEYLDESMYRNALILNNIINGLLKGLEDPSLPVQAAAACSLRHLINEEGAVDIIRPRITGIVSEYFRIMKETDTESILSSLQVIVEQFAEEIKPIAATMISHLLDSFIEYSSSGNDDDEAAFNASQCLDTIACIIEGLEGEDAILATIEVGLVPLLQKVFNNDDCFEYIDGCLQILQMLTYFTDNISPIMWSFCPILLNALDTYAIDYIGEIMIPLVNFMVKDITTYINVVPGNDVMTLQIVQKIFTNSEDNDKDTKYAASLLSCMILCSKSIQAMHAHMPSILHMIYSRLYKKDVTISRGLRSKLIENVFACIYYDPSLTMSIIAPIPGALEQLLAAMLYVDNDSKETSQFCRLRILCFTTILNLNTATLHPLMMEAFPAMFRIVIKSLCIIDELEQQEGEEEEDGDYDIADGDDDGDDDGDIPEGGYDEDEDCIDADGEEYLKLLAGKAAAKRNEKSTTYIGGMPVEDDDEWDDDVEDYGFNSSVDKVNVLQVFVDTLNYLTASSPAIVTQINGSLDSDDQSSLQKLLQTYAEAQQTSNNNV